MRTYFITGAAQRVTNSVERLTAMRQHPPEWDERPNGKAAARERLAPAAERADGNAEHALYRTRGKPVLVMPVSQPASDDLSNVRRIVPI